MDGLKKLGLVGAIAAASMLGACERKTTDEAGSSGYIGTEGSTTETQPDTATTPGGQVTEPLPAEDSAGTGGSGTPAEPLPPDDTSGLGGTQPAEPLPADETSEPIEGEGSTEDRSGGMPR